MTEAQNTSPAKVFVICAGLGIARRGFETAFRECFDALQGDPSVDLWLLKGGGSPLDREIVVPCINRNHPLIRWLAKLTRQHPYSFEQLSFSIALIPILLRHRPHVCYFSEETVGRCLSRWRRFSGQTFRLLLRNGGPLYPPYGRYDAVQETTAMQHQLALHRGESPEKLTQLPEGFRINPDFEPTTPEVKLSLKTQLGLPSDRPLILSVGAINCYHKRMDYLIREVAALPRPRPYLVMLGHWEEESPQVEALARTLLGEENYQIKTVGAQEVSQYYRAADLFVLASLLEGFGRVYVEALSHGLPCLAHNYPVAREIVGEPEALADFNRTGSLTCLLQNYLARPANMEEARLRHRRVYEKFSWASLRNRYLDLLRRVALSAPGTNPLASKVDDSEFQSKEPG